MKKFGLVLLAGVTAFTLAACGGQSGGKEDSFTATLTTGAEIPAPEVGTATPTGSVAATLSGDSDTLTVSGNFSGLTGPATMAHIHVGDTGATGGVVCTLTIDNETSGDISGDCQVREDGKIEDGFINLQGLRDGDYYVNVHTEANAPGEIRGQLE